ncbi:hypothetical protein [Ornithinibacillus scapharcae]|uniref:hypothetical protein n=1 Tax=Ornithinibacillus scapharcae TaxID=1147159 RepID=UPI000225BACE|nr:hypothetical protein [Ornithinibacillus scapharcae]
MDYYYNPEVKRLLKNHSDKRVTVSYLDRNFILPKIGPRPPYYTNPRYEPYMPIL